MEGTVTGAGCWVGIASEAGTHRLIIGSVGWFKPPHPTSRDTRSFAQGLTARKGRGPQGAGEHGTEMMMTTTMVVMMMMMIDDGDGRGSRRRRRGA